MTALLDFFRSEPVLALLVAVGIFFITLFLTVKQWIGLSITCILLLFSLVAGVIINSQQALQHYVEERHLAVNLADDHPQEAFKKQLVQAVEDLKQEVNTEKENLQRLATQVQEVFENLEAQKQKLQDFIEETKEHFKTEPKPVSSELSHNFINEVSEKL